MRKTRDRKPPTVDVDHLRMLHEEAIDQLELMRTALEAAEQATGTMRDNLEELVLNHWNVYLDVLHMISMHDEAMSTALKKYGMTVREVDETDTTDRQFGSRLLLALLLFSLIRHHRRMCHLYGWRGSPMGDYLKESMTMEREHTAELISMVQTMI